MYLNKRPHHLFDGAFYFSLLCFDVKLISEFFI